MTDLARRLARQIAATGPITLADYMAACLLDPEHGYYTTRPPFGAAGDFTTAPEISQMFGEMLALCLAQCWIDRGRPAPAVLAELGPGRGTLMADMLRTLAAVPGAREALAVHMVEAAPALRARQAEAIAPARATWHDHVAALPEAPLFLVANEFLDALPIRQFRRAGDGWQEVMVGLDPAGRLAPGLSPAAPVAALAHRLADTQDGAVVELCPALPGICAKVAGRIARHGGAALIIDYGGWAGTGDTFQAVRAHAPADPFAAPGAADLTAHVDFAAIATAARAAGAEASAMSPQGLFLERLGITARAEALARRLTGAARDNHVAAHRRLTHPDGMGELFKVIAIHPPGTPPPPGLDPLGAPRGPAA